MKKQFVKDQMQRSPRAYINSEHLKSTVPERAGHTYHCSLFVGEEDPDNGLLGGARVGSACVSGGLQDSQSVRGRGESLRPCTNPTTSYLDFKKGW